jgi:hypothetical protein
MDAKTIMDNRTAITVTLDDGYPVALNALSFENNSGYIKNTLSRRLMFQSPLDILNIHISGLRRDLWLSLEKFVELKTLSVGEGPPESTGRTEQSIGGKDDIRLGKWDHEIHRLIELMLMGEILEAPTFLNAVMDRLISAYQRFYQENDGRVPLGNVNHIFEKSTNQNLMRFIVDILIFGMPERTRLQALLEGHLELFIERRSALREYDTQDDVRDAPWDHRGQ